MKIKANAKFWDVRFSVPAARQIKQSDGSVKDYLYPRNIHMMAAADSAAKVNELVLAEHPDAVIHQINHRGGDCGIIVQPELMEAMPCCT